MMWETNTFVFITKLQQFLLEFNEHTALIAYIKRYYLNDAKPRHWCVAFRPETFNNMESNNYVKCWLVVSLIIEWKYVKQQ